jgi:hypothetical protein
MMSRLNRTERRGVWGVCGSRWGAGVALGITLAALPALIEKTVWGKSSTAGTRTTAHAGDQNSAEAARRAIARLPVRFEPSADVTKDHAAFVARGLGYSVAIAPTEARFSLGKTSREPLRHAQAGEGAAPSQVTMALVAANSKADVSGADILPGTSNYFTGTDSKNWRRHVAQYGRVNLHGVYPGIDLTYYGTESTLEYDFIVAPGADPKSIALEFSGADSVAVNDRDELVLETANGPLRQKRPTAYQVIDGTTRTVASRYVVAGNTVSFELGAYDAAAPLVIDPVLTYSTFFGGSGDDSGFGIAVGPNGDLFVAGYTTSTNFPGVESIQSASAGNADGFILRLDASGSVLVYATYLGGPGPDTFYGIAVDAAGNAYVTGQASRGFPVTADAIQSQTDGVSAVVVQLTPLGDLQYSTLVGGSVFTFGESIALDPAGNIYIAGETDATTDFPVTPGAVQTANGEGLCRLGPESSPGGCDDGFIIKFTQDGGQWHIGYATYLGGHGHDWVHSITADATGRLYATGITSSDDFPLLGAAQATRGGGFDAFVTILSPAGALQYSSYFGGNDDDEGRGIMVDGSGNVVVVGSTRSTNLPVRNALQSRRAGGEDTFIAKWAPNNTPVFITYLGGTGTDRPLASGIDSAGNIFVGGYTDSNNFPTKFAFQAMNKGQSGGNAFIAKLPPSGSPLTYSTYFGGGSFTAIRGLAAEANGNVAITGTTTPDGSRTGFPLAYPYIDQPIGGDDAFIARIGDGFAGDASALLSCTMVPAADLIRSVLNAAIAKRATAAADPDRHDLDDLIHKLTDALDTKQWNDNRRPGYGVGPGRPAPAADHGEQVFDRLKDALHKVTDLGNKDHRAVDAATLSGWAVMLGQAAQSAACQAIQDAAASLPSPRRDGADHVQHALEHLVRGNIAAQMANPPAPKPGFDRMIDEYKHAWQEAVADLRK